MVGTSELGHKHLKLVMAPVFVESWLVYADVDGLLDTHLEPTWFPIQNVHFLKVYMMAWRLNVDMLGNSNDKQLGRL